MLVISLIVIALAVVSCFLTGFLVLGIVVIVALLLIELTGSLFIEGMLVEDEELENDVDLTNFKTLHDNPLLN